MKKESILGSLSMEKQMEKDLLKIFKIEVFSKEFGRKEKWLKVA